MLTRIGSINFKNIYIIKNLGIAKSNCPNPRMRGHTKLSTSKIDLLYVLKIYILTANDLIEML